MLIGKQSDGSVTEIESRDVDFIEDEFPSKGEVDRSLELHEIVEQEESASRNLVENEEEILQAPTNYKKDLNPSGRTPLVNQSQQPQPHRSKRESIPRHRFEIKGEAFMVAPHDNDKPRIIHEALSSSTKDEWMKALNDEIESMKTNQVWDLVDLPTGRKAIGNK